jgi:hypothetical protein
MFAEDTVDVHRPNGLFERGLDAATAREHGLGERCRRSHERRSYMPLEMYKPAATERSIQLTGCHERREAGVDEAIDDRPPRVRRYDVSGRVEAVGESMPLVRLGDGCSAPAAAPSPCAQALERMGLSPLRRTSARQLPTREVDAFVDRLGAGRTRPEERRR